MFASQLHNIALRHSHTKSLIYTNPQQVIQFSNCMNLPYRTTCPSPSSNTMNTNNVPAVIVKDFGDRTSERDLFTMCEKVTTFTSMELKTTETDERIAIITVANRDGVRRLINEYNFCEVSDGEILRVGHYRPSRDPAVAQDNIHRDYDVFIRDLPANVAREALYELFPKNTIVNCRVSGVRPGHAYIQFKSAELAENAKTKDGTTFRGCKISVSKYLSKREFAANNLQISNFGDFFASDEALRLKFEEHGNVVSAALKGTVGFVAFENHSDAQKAVGLNREILPNGRCLHVEFQKDFQSNSEGKNIIINNLPTTVCEDRLRAIFEKFGKIVGVTVGTRKGFVNFDSKQVAMNAVKAMDRQVVDGWSVRVNIVQKTAKPVVKPFMDLTNKMRYHRGVKN